jgi:hypothetical protein
LTVEPRVLGSFAPRRGAKQSGSSLGSYREIAGRTLPRHIIKGSVNGSCPHGDEVADDELPVHGWGVIRARPEPILTEGTPSQVQPASVGLRGPLILVFAGGWLLRAASAAKATGRDSSRGALDTCESRRCEEWRRSAFGDALDPTCTLPIPSVVLGEVSVARVALAA